MFSVQILTVQISDFYFVRWLIYGFSEQLLYNVVFLNCSYCSANATISFLPNVIRPLPNAKRSWSSYSYIR